jgi:hypothetical protein
MSDENGDGHTTDYDRPTAGMGLIYHLKYESPNYSGDTISRMRVLGTLDRPDIGDYSPDIPPEDGTLSDSEHRD